MEIEIDDPTRPDVTALLTEHLADMYATSPAESVHALDVAALTAPGITFWTAREDGILLGCGALREVDPTHAEIKSMRTTAAARGRGVAAAVLARMTEVARERGCARLSLETGVEEYFESARRLYLRHGFTASEPFGDYRPDRHSVFLTKEL
ncbi:MAG: GNAT family N-acetyltransferase [Propionibacteriales bacterium]|nr:GNAT family N-acetyltransferase [Propionibacteriales bacterium]